MDYEALKEQWSEVEDRDGVRLSWNTFPSTRMVGFSLSVRCGSRLATDLSYRKRRALLSPSELSTPP